MSMDKDVNDFWLVICGLACPIAFIASLMNYCSNGVVETRWGILHGNEALLMVLVLFVFSIFSGSWAVKRIVKLFSKKNSTEKNDS